VDDEYALAGTRDPKICITTSRDPSSRLKQFTKEMKLIFPNAQSINRGNTKVPELLDVRLRVLSPLSPRPNIDCLARMELSPL
jgi:hypothetical protein